MELKFEVEVGVRRGWNGGVGSDCSFPSSHSISIVMLLVNTGQNLVIIYIRQNGFHQFIYGLKRCLITNTIQIGYEFMEPGIIKFNCCIKLLQVTFYIDIEFEFTRTININYYPIMIQYHKCTLHSTQNKF